MRLLLPQSRQSSHRKILYVVDYATCAFHRNMLERVTPCYDRERSATGTLRSAKRTSDKNLPELRRSSAYSRRGLLLL